MNPFNCCRLDVTIRRLHHYYLYYDGKALERHVLTTLRYQAIASLHNQCLTKNSKAVTLFLLYRGKCISYYLKKNLMITFSLCRLIIIGKHLQKTKKFDLVYISF